MTPRLVHVFEEVDKINAEDPNVEYIENTPFPKELLYGQRMTRTLESFSKNPSELLQIAARGQHIRRWTIPRAEYPVGREGYLKWRTALKILHSDLVGDIMLKNGYDAQEVTYVKNLLMKKNLKSNPEAQTLEDVVCLVFLKFYIDEFAALQDDEKMIGILQKTWAKMSEDARESATKLKLSDHVSELMASALG